MIGNIKQLRDQMNANAGKRSQWLGVILTWDLSGRDANGRVVTLPVGELQELLRDHNLGVTLGTVRLNRAIVRTLEALARDGLIQAEKVDRSTNNAQRAVYHLVHKEVDEANDEFSYRTRTRVIYDKTAGPGEEVTFQGPLAESELRPLFERYRTEYLMSDLSERILLPTVLGAACGIKLRRMGGTYFVPQERLAVLDNLAAFLEAVTERYGANVVLSPFPVVDNPISRDSMGSAAMAALLSDIRELDIDLREMEGEDRRDKVTEKTARGYDEQVRALLDKAQVLTRYSTMQIETIDSACAALRTRIRRLQPKVAAEGEGRGERADDASAEVAEAVAPDADAGERGERLDETGDTPRRGRARRTSGAGSDDEGQPRQGRN